MTTYTNLDGTTPDKGFGAIVKWQIVDRVAGRRRRDPGGFVTPRRENDGAALAANGAHLTWIGHASFAQRLGGKLVVTDPILGLRVGTFRRHTAPGVAIENLPKVDIVTVSHSHYDHLDVPSLVALGKRHDEQPLYIVPRDVGEILRDAGLRRVVELGWWDTHREGDLAITLVPAQHWSMRFPWDRNKRLWGGFVFQGPDGTSYHAGDTAFSERVFQAIRERCPRIDWAMIPIGAYDPQWFMQPQHMNPEEAGRAWEILDAQNLCAMHWGTFKLTDEPMGEPPQRLRAWFASKSHDPSRLWIFDIGETRPLAGTR